MTRIESDLQTLIDFQDNAPASTPWAVHAAIDARIDELRGRLEYQEDLREERERHTVDQRTHTTA